MYTVHTAAYGVPQKYERVIRQSTAAARTVHAAVKQVHVLAPVATLHCQLLALYNK